MIGLLVVGHAQFAHGLIESVEHTFGARPPRLEAAAIDYRQGPEAMAEGIRQQLQHVKTDDGALILADVYGSTHTNLACTLLEPARVELIAGVNLPMLLRALTYRHLPLTELVERALAGGTAGIVRATAPGQRPAPRPDDGARP